MTQILVYESPDAMERVRKNMASALVAQGADHAEAALQAKIQLWGMDNPYQYIYSLSKEEAIDKKYINQVQNEEYITVTPKYCN